MEHPAVLIMHWLYEYNTKRYLRRLWYEIMSNIIANRILI